MIPIRSLTASSRIVERRGPAPLLSVVLLCTSPHDEDNCRSLLERLLPYQPTIELVVVVEPPLSTTRADTCRCKEHGTVVLEHNSPCGLRSLRFDEGILASCGRWIWLIDSSEPVPKLDLGLVLSLLKDSADRPIVCVHPDDENSLISIAGVKLPWIDMLYKGWQFPLQNIFFPRALFNTHGLLDPHIVMEPFFQQEFLVRICRFVQFRRVTDSGAVRGVKQRRFPKIYHHWLDVNRTPLLTREGFSDYAVDDLAQFDRQIPAEDLWGAYLDYVLPYYYTFRHVLDEGQPELPQSFPPPNRHVLCVKGDYETSLDVGFRNFDFFAQGQRFFKLTFVHLGQIGARETIPDEAILLLRTADHSSLALARKAIDRGVPVGYALDDDLLHFSEYGGDFAAFRAGHPAYDAMVETIRQVDVVLAGGPYVERSVQRHNKRTVHFEGSVLPDFLSESGPRRRGAPFRFGYAGGGYRAEEMRMLWPAVQRICRKYGKKVRFEFWGIDPSKLPGKLEQVSCVPFSIAYYEYLERLKGSRFDAMLVPLLYDPAPRRGKLPNKLYETAVSGAVGLFSDVPTYQVVRKHRLGITAKENAESWYESMTRVIEMSEDEYTDLQTRCLSFVKQFYTTPAMLPVHEQGLHAIFFHAATRGLRVADGLPRVMYAFPSISPTAGGVIVFKRRMELAKRAGICPLALIPAFVKDTPDWIPFRRYLEQNNIPYDFAWYRVFVLTPPRDNVLPIPEEERSVRQVLTRHRVALVHSGGYAPALGKVCSEMGIPHIVAHYSVDDQYEWPMGRLPFKYCNLVHSDSIHYAKKWAELLQTDWFCARDVAPESLFDLGFERLYGEEAKFETARTVRVGIVGTLMPRKSQLEAIQAVSMLIREGHRIRFTIFGDVNADPDYYRQCQKALDRLGISDFVVFKGHVEDLREIYANLDIVLSVSTYVRNISESFATSIKEATASGTLVVASQAGGIGELMKDEINCILTRGCEPHQIAEAILRAMSLSKRDTLALKRNAFRMAREEFHPRRGLLDLLAMYNSVLRIQPSPTRPPLRVDSLQQEHAETFVPLEMLPTRRGLLQVTRSPTEVRRIIVASVRVLEREGIRSLWRQIRIKIRRREFKIAECSDYCSA